MLLYFLVGGRAKPHHAYVFWAWYPLINHVLKHQNFGNPGPQLAEVRGNGIATVVDRTISPGRVINGGDGEPCALELPLTVKREVGTSAKIVTVKNDNA